LLFSNLAPKKIKGLKQLYFWFLIRFGEISSLHEQN